MIWEQLDKELIHIGVEASNCEEALTALGKVFIKEGYCKETYIEALKEREKEFPTGLDINGYGVAIPHTSVTHVNKAGTGIAILKSPVTFLQMGTDDEEVEVGILFMLAVVEPQQHLQDLKRILAIIQDNAVLSSLAVAKSKEEIINIIKEKELTL